MGVFHQGVYSLIVHLWNRGIPVTAWCATDTELVLLCWNGWEISVERRMLGLRVDMVAQQIADHWPMRRPGVLDVPTRVEDVPEIAPRTLAWWRFLRWLQEQNNPREDPEVVAAGTQADAV